MKTIRLSLATILFLTFVLTDCNQDEIECSKNNEFCAFISSEEYSNTGTLINNYLGGLETSLSDEEKLERLRNWLKCKSCVANVEILCNSCIRTNPPQSELKLWLIVNGQQKEKILDIIMDDPLRFSTYHD